MDELSEPIDDFLDHVPTKVEKAEMRKATKSPSAWLKLLCRDWAMENMDIAQGTDLKFLNYKGYLKGRLTSQLLCRLSIPELGKESEIDATSVDFWKILGIHDEFDIRHIISQVEKFCVLYAIRSTISDDDILGDPLVDPPGTGTEALTVSPLHNFLPSSLDINRTSPGRREPRRLPIAERRETMKNRDGKRAVERAKKETTREEKRQKKQQLRQEREKIAQEQKDAALQRAADLVRSNRIPIEITRGAAVVKSVYLDRDSHLAHRDMEKKDGDDSATKKKVRSDIIVSTASDLDQIVTHAKNLWAKYNAIAKEHNQKISWAMISKELGIHVKVREKYARMHTRALQRGFDFVKSGDYKIKDHPEIFLEPVMKKLKDPVTHVSHTAQITSTETLPLSTTIVNQPLQQEDLDSSVHCPSEGERQINASPITTHPGDGDQHQHHHHQTIHISQPHLQTPLQNHDNSIDVPPAVVHHSHLSMYTSREMSQHITDDQVAAAVDAAIKTVPVNHHSDFDAAAEQAAEVALAAGPTHLGNVDEGSPTEV